MPSLWPELVTDRRSTVTLECAWGKDGICADGTVFVLSECKLT